MTEITSRTAYTNLLWRFLERFGAQGVTFIVSLVLARILDPQTYGAVAIITVIISILQVFVDSGFGTALIQKKESDDLDFSTVFYFNLFLSSFLYLCLFFSSPFIASFFDISSLSLLVRIAGLLLFIFAFKNVQQAYVSKHLMFKKFFFSTLIGTIGAAIIGIVLALNGFGVWALIIQLLFNNAVDALILWLTVKWKPKFLFSFKRLGQLFKYGWKLLVSSLIMVTYNEARQLVIGKMYTTEDLAHFNRGHQLPYIMTTNINASIDSVMLPIMSRVQDDKYRVKEITRRTIRISSFVIWPMMMGLAVCSYPLIKIILTEKWLPCIPYLIIFCIAYSFYPVTTANLNAIKAIGKSGVYLILEIIKKTVGVLTLIVSMWFGPFWIAVACLFMAVFDQAVILLPNKKLLNYSIIEQIKDVLPAFLLSAFMGACVYKISTFGLSEWLTLAIQVPLGIFIYIAVAYLFKVESLTYIVQQAKSFLCSKQKK